MLKSGLIFAGIALLLAVGSTVVISPLCVSCLAFFLGLGAGYVACVFDKPIENNAAVKAGALAGLISGVGNFVGQAIGTAINAVIVGPEGAAAFMRQLGMEPGAMEGVVAGYWGGLIGSVCCGGAVVLLLAAGLGALGGILWWQMTGKNSIPSV